ncbi:MAG: HD-GYP domain-containing protein [Burkholderiaceae bacterium]|nr:HD-GYP domain-containing protein [Burkholderiaceae bacterium]
MIGREPGKEPRNGGTGSSRWSRSYVEAADFFSARLDEILAALGDVDAQTREAALRALIDSLRGLQSKALDHTTADIADHYGRLFRDLHAPEHRPLQVEGLLLTARILFGCGSRGRAVHFARHALGWARTLGIPELHRQAANLSGAYCLKQRDFAAALTLLEEAYEVARANGLEDGRLSALGNLATCLQDAGYYEGAIEVNRGLLASEEIPSSMTGRSCVANALGNLVYCHLVRGELHDALVTGERGAKVFASLDPTFNPLARHQFECFFNAALLEAGRTEEARERLRRLRQAQLSGNPRTEVMFALAQGLCEVFSGQSDIGISRLEKLLPRAQNADSYVDDVLRALIRAHEKAGDLRRALEYVEQLTTYFAAMRTRQLHQLLSQIQKEALAELDPQSHAEVLLGDHAADLRVKSFQQEVAARERTLLEDWAVAASLVDDETGSHCFKVGRLAYLTAARLGFDHGRSEIVEMAARLHDIGKIGISHQVLLKPSRLTEAERLIIRKHPVIGAEMLAKSSHPGAQLAALVARTHHEWWDGTGYPSGLKFEEIPVESRIVSLADAYDVLTSGRVHKRTCSHEAALEELRFMAGRQFDPELVEVFAAMVSEYVEHYGEAGDAAYRAAVEDSAILKRQGNVKRLLAGAGH